MDKEIIRQSVIEMFKSNVLFSEFDFQSFNIQKIRTPAIGEYYDFNFVSNSLDRWLFFRIEDFGREKRIIVWINLLNNKKPVNFDLLSYFIIYLKDADLKRQFYFNSNSQEELIEKIKKSFEYIVKKADDRLKDLILGVSWIDMEFDWQSYK